MSIRESIRILLKAERFIAKGVVPSQVAGSNSHEKVHAISFEDLCNKFRFIATTNDGSHLTDASLWSLPMSCGHTVQCLLSLFVSQKQIHPSSLDYIINGTPLGQLLSIPNVILHGYRIAYTNYLYNLCGYVHTIEDTIRYRRLSRSISKRSAKHGLDRLQTALFKVDEDVHLPRVLFCSIVWVHPECLGPNGTVVDGIAHAEYGIWDHKFAIIKHSNDRFQILQGYIKVDATSSDPGATTVAPTNILKSGDFGLADWQKSGLAYSYPDGIDRRCVDTFVEGLERFVQDDAFNYEEHERLFGVNLRSEKDADRGQYWPSLFHCELEDVDIIGYGERPIADAIESYIDSIPPSNSF